MMKDAAYWIALAHLPRWGHLKINNLIVKFHHEFQISIEEFFQLGVISWRDDYQLDDKQIADLLQARSELGSNAFLVESLFSQGYEIIPLISTEYSRTLKSNLKAAHSPAVLYLKGNKKILEENSVAIVGSRDATEIGLKFTDNVAKRASQEFKVVVSGFAKGIDKQALDSAISYKGQSIIVLPQGIMTFGSGFKTYYQQIIAGDVLVLSTFYPKAPWKTELAMARNPIIYGLASEIYVAESAEKGGTWSGVMDGLKKGRKIYVRQPNEQERNANNILIARGAVPVDMEGNVVPRSYELQDPKDISVVKEASFEDEAEIKIRSLLELSPVSAKDILKKLELSWTSRKLTSFMKRLDFVETIKEKKLTIYRLKRPEKISQTSLFFD